MHKDFFIRIWIIILIVFACNKDTYDFPYVLIRLDLGLYSDLGQLGPGEVLFKDGYGVKGLIIYRDTDNNYFVFDRACTHEIDFSCAVDTSSFSSVVECPCCNSRFLLGESADPIKGPASHPLMRYNAYIDGSFLKIIN